ADHAPCATRKVSPPPAGPCPACAAGAAPRVQPAASAAAAPRIRLRRCMSPPRCPRCRHCVPCRQRQRLPGGSHMTHTARRFAPAPGSWVSIGLIYLYGVLTTASLSKIIPILGDIGASLGATPAQFALLISLMTILPAVLASVAGSIVDRIGAHRALQVVAVIGMAVNAAYLLSDSLGAFMAVRVVEGLLAVGAYSAAPGLIMATAADARRRRAMAVWSTYSPVGVSLGLALSGSFAGTAEVGSAA